MLYLIGTPIGNLQDISFRALDILKQCDYLLCEDTRHTSGLLHHFQIKTELKSYHKFNEQQTVEAVISDLKAGKTIGLVSDAGLPALADPGEILVRRCREEKLPINVIAGPTAAVMALVLSGFATHPFQFIGFLEKKESACKEQLLDILSYNGTSVAYETPHRIQKTLELLAQIAPTLRLFLARELTKLHEEGLQGTAAELLLHPSLQEPRGEMVLVFEKAPPKAENESLSPEEEVALFEKEYHLSRKEAIKLVAERRGIPKRTLYHLNFVISQTPPPSAREGVSD